MTAVACATTFWFAMGRARGDDPAGGGDRGRPRKSAAAALAPSSATSSAQGLPRRNDPLRRGPALRVGRRRVVAPPGRAAKKKARAREPFHLWQAGRKAFRAATHGSDVDWVDSDGLSFLERSSLAPGSLALYQETYHAFLRRCQAQQLPTRTAGQLDLALLDALHEMFREGEMSSEAQKLISVIKKFRPVIRGAGTVPRRQTAVRGFRRLAPPNTRQPLP